MTTQPVPTIQVGDATYIPQPNPTDHPIRIVVLQRGWVMIGRWTQTGDDCTLTDAHVIRIWGTTKGLGEIAQGGPTSSTKLDKAGIVHFHIMTTVVVLDCEETKWKL